MQVDEDGKLWFYPGEDNICLDKNRLQELLDRYSEFPEEVYKNDMKSWQYDLGDDADALFNEIIEQKRAAHQGKKVAMWRGAPDRDHPRDTLQSIYWEILSKVQDASFEGLTIEDIPMLQKFLNTPKGQELETWEEWEVYWERRERERIEEARIEEESKLYLYPGADNLCLDRERLQELLDKYSKLLAESRENGVQEWGQEWQWDLENEFSALIDEIIAPYRAAHKDKKVEVRRGDPERDHPRDTLQSIYWEILTMMGDVYLGGVTIEDIPMLQKFLNTPKGRELEAWEEWEAYWRKKYGEELSLG